MRRIGLVAYDIALPTNIEYHNVFHVSLLKKYIHDPNHIIDWNVIQVESKGYFQVQPMRILDKKFIVLKNRAIGKVMVQWVHYKPKDVAWEMEDVM